MKAEGVYLSKLLRSPQAQFTIPIYQRPYSWKTYHCKQLWEDILSAGVNANAPAHFIGPIVYIEEKPNQASQMSEYLVIDGQQRLTTVMLILEALARKVGDNEVEGLSAEKIRNYYLTNPFEKGDDKYKMLLKDTDKDSLKAVVEHREESTRQSLHIGSNFDWFRSRINGLDDDEVGVLCRGLNKLTIVDISLRRPDDEPQRIFESMNSTGYDLSQADLIRNYVLMGLDRDAQNKLYGDQWRPMEDYFGQKGYDDHFDKFMRHYLTMKNGNIPDESGIYKEFKKHARVSDTDTYKLVEDMREFAGYYCAVVLDKEQDEALAKAFHDLAELGTAVPAYPLLLHLYRDYRHKLLTGTALAEIVRLLESFVFRRAVCRLPSNSHNKVFLAALDKYKKDRRAETIQDHLLEQHDNYNFPSDEDFESGFTAHRDRRSKYWLYRLENDDRREAISKADYNGRQYTIEHIMPRKLTNEWRDSLGSQHERIHEQLLDSPGNITLTGYNTKYSNKSFAFKRDTDGGFKESPLKINKNLADADVWDEEAIKDRAALLAKMAVGVWKYPN